MNQRQLLLARTFLGGAMLFLLQVRSHAQTSQATLQGQVTEQDTGKPVGRALIIERNLQTNGQAYRYTNEQGFYYFSALLPGTYTVRVDARGFQPEERSAVELPVASRIELNFTLKAGETTPALAVPTKPQVGASAADILSIMYGSDAAIPQALMISLPVQATETLVGSVSNLIDERQLLELPLAGRDVYSLLVLQPGVTADNATARGLGFSVNGQRVGSSNFLLDGVDNNDLMLTGPATFVSAEAVKEYRMTTSNYTAEFGRASAFVANAITRTGTNALHGSLYEFFNHDRLNANSFAYNWQGVRRPPFRQNQYGATVGGPWKRDRLFFFANFEQARTSSESAPLSVGVVTPELVSLMLDGTPAKQLLTDFPPPAAEPIPGLELFAIKDFIIPAVQRNTLALGRVDYQSTDGRHHWSGRYAFSQQTLDDFFFSVYPGLNAPLVNRRQNFSANYIRDLYSGTNELKFGYSRNEVRLLRPHPEIPTISSDDGVLSPSFVLLPGMESSFDYSVRDSVFHVVENFSRLSGKHALGLGLEWRLGFNDSLFSPFGNADYLFESWLEFFIDWQPSTVLLPINRFTGSSPSRDDFWRYYRQGEWAAFLQDNIKLARRLTLNLGMRYEYFGVPAPRNGTRDSNFIFGQGQNIGERITSGNLQAGTLYERDGNNFAPRLGFAWDAEGNGKSVLRGSYGIFLDRIFNNIWLNVRNNDFPVQCLVQPFSALECNIPSIHSPFEFAIPASQGVGPLNPASIQNTSTVALDTKLRTPYSQNWFLGFQRELTPNLVLEVNQVGSLGRKLIAADAINRPNSELPSLANPHGRFNPNYGEILYYATEGHSNHVAAEIGITHRWSHGVQFQLSYTYARTKDVQSDPLIVPGTTDTASPVSRLAASNLGFAPVFTEQFNPSGNFGNSDFDQRHNLVMNFVAQTPRFSGWQRLLSGWQASGLVGIRSGFPFTIEVPPAPGVGERGIWNRADFTGSSLDQAFLVNPTQIPGGVQLLDPSKFQAPVGNQVGNLARNALYGPGFWNVDFGLSRTFALPGPGEEKQLQFRAEFFNLFNHTNLGNPERFWGSPTFGQASFGRQGFASSLPSVSPLNEQPRRFQLAVKVYF